MAVRSPSLSPVADTSSTVAEAYCRRRGLPIGDFERAVLRETLHPAARRLRFVLALLPHYFEPDRRFLRYVGQLRRLDDLRYEEIDFQQDRTNRGFLRGRLRLRVSSRRVRELVIHTLESGQHPLSPLLSELVIHTARAT